MSQTLAFSADFAAALPGPAPFAEAPRRRLAIGVLALHALFVWALMQQEFVQQVVQKARPIVVSLISQPEPPKPQVLVAPPQLPMAQIPALTVPVPEVQIQAPAITPQIAVTPPPAQPQPQLAAPIMVAAPVQPPAPPAIKTLPPGAVRYLAEPRLVVPTLSRRLGEQGVVHLRVIVDVRGLPREIALKKSSGFARLDQQALLDMRSARFVPQTENGQPIEWEVVAPLSYELER
jgi:protein TonB